jgi:hypothetical protein
MAGTLVTDTLQDSSGNSTATTNAIRGSAKAWVNFNGSGAASMRSSFNVSSVQYIRTGVYQVNFTNSFADANYVTQITAGNSGSSPYYATTPCLTDSGTPLGYAKGYVVFSMTGTSAGGTQDSNIACVACFS